MANKYIVTVEVVDEAKVQEDLGRILRALMDEYLEEGVSQTIFVRSVSTWAQYWGSPG